MTHQATDLVLRNVRLVDGRGVQAERADVRIAEGVIREISDGGNPIAADGQLEVDLAGRVLAPGLINCHTHVCLDASADPAGTLRGESLAETTIRTARRLEQVVRAGVTTIRDLGGRDYLDLALVAMVERGELAGPRMFCAARMITMTGGHGWWLGLEADGPTEIRRVARQLIKAGARAIKVMATGGVMTPGQVAGAPQLTVEEIAAATEEAHKAGLTVAAHAESAQGATNAILGGVDSVEHGHGIDRPTIDLMLERGTVLVPTILSDVNILEYGLAAGIPDYVVEKTKIIYPGLVTALEEAISAGVTIVAGNDGGTPFVDSADLVSELELYVRHGLQPRQALKAATGDAAALLGQTNLGLIEQGYEADLLVLEADPLEDVSRLRDPSAVIARGAVVGGLESLERLTALAAR